MLYTCTTNSRGHVCCTRVQLTWTVSRLFHSFCLYERLLARGWERCQGLSAGWVENNPGIFTEPCVFSFSSYVLNCIKAPLATVCRVQFANLRDKSYNQIKHLGSTLEVLTFIVSAAQTLHHAWSWAGAWQWNCGLQDLKQTCKRCLAIFGMESTKLGERKAPSTKILTYSESEL